MGLFKNAISAGRNNARPKVPTSLIPETAESFMSPNVDANPLKPSFIPSIPLLIRSCTFPLFTDSLN